MSTSCGNLARKNKDLVVMLFIVKPRGAVVDLNYRRECSSEYVNQASVTLEIFVSHWKWHDRGFQPE
jgi:hypothetical protein